MPQIFQTLTAQDAPPSAFKHPKVTTIKLPSGLYSGFDFSHRFQSLFSSIFTTSFFAYLLKYNASCLSAVEPGATCRALHHHGGFYLHFAATKACSGDKRMQVGVCGTKAVFRNCSDKRWCAGEQGDESVLMCFDSAQGSLNVEPPLTASPEGRR